MIELPEEQRRGPDGLEYVLIPKDVYEKLKSLLDDDARVMYALLAHVDPEDWEDASVYE